MPSLRFTPGARSNCIAEYATIWKWLPHGSAKSSPRAPGSMIVEALALDGGAHRGDVVDDEAEVALVVGGLPPALHERDELVAHVDERRARHAAAQLEREQAPVERQRGVDIGDLERHVVHADQPGPLLHAANLGDDVAADATA